MIITTLGVSAAVVMLPAPDKTARIAKVTPRIISSPRVRIPAIGSPTHTLKAAEIVCDMLAMKPFPTGLYHLAASGAVSRYEMTRYLFERLGITTKVDPCKTSDFKTAARRPLNSRFDCHKLQTLLGRAIPTWQEMLNGFLEAEY